MKLTILNISETKGQLSKVKELVYNPITSNPENEKQKGIVGGQLKDKASWKGHDNHLHIGVDDKDIMIAIMNKAKEMGLEVSENPYAFEKKWDTNGMQKHSSGGYHYQNFPGLPKVGKGVDINYGFGSSYSVEKEKLKPFIEWIHTEYGNLPVEKIKISDIPSEDEQNDDSVEELTKVGKEDEEITQADIDAVNDGTNYKTDISPTTTTHQDDKNLFDEKDDEETQQVTTTNSTENKGFGQKLKNIFTKKEPMDVSGQNLQEEIDRMKDLMKKIL